MIVVCTTSDIRNPVEESREREKKNLRAFKDNCITAIFLHVQHCIVSRHGWLQKTLRDGISEWSWDWTVREASSRKPFWCDGHAIGWFSTLDTNRRVCKFFRSPKTRSERSIKVAISRVLIRALKNLWSPARSVPTSDHRVFSILRGKSSLSDFYYAFKLDNSAINLFTLRLRVRC